MFSIIVLVGAGAVALLKKYSLVLSDEVVACAAAGSFAAVADGSFADGFVADDSVDDASVTTLSLTTLPLLLMMASSVSRFHLVGYAFVSSPLAEIKVAKADA